MKENNFIKKNIQNKLMKIRNIFVDFNPLYEFDESQNTYFILLTKKQNSNSKVEEICGKLILDLLGMPMTQQVCFITEDSLTKLKNPSYLYIYKSDS